MLEPAGEPTSTRSIIASTILVVTARPGIGTDSSAPSAAVRAYLAALKTSSVVVLCVQPVMQLMVRDGDVRRTAQRARDDINVMLRWVKKACLGHGPSLVGLSVEVSRARPWDLSRTSAA